MSTTPGEISSPQTGSGLSIDSGIQRLSKLPVRLSVRLCHETMKLSQVAALAPGRCIRFQASCETPLELMAGGSQIAIGKAVQNGDRLGFHLNRFQ